MNYQKVVFRALYLTPLFTLCLGSFFLSGCQKKGGAEAAGERVDEIIDNVKEGENPLSKKGPAEKAGEALDQAIVGKK